MEDIDGGLHPAVDGQSLDEDEDEYCEALVWRISKLAVFWGGGGGGGELGSADHICIILAVS